MTIKPLRMAIAMVNVENSPGIMCKPLIQNFLHTKFFWFDRKIEKKEKNCKKRKTRKKK